MISRRKLNKTLVGLPLLGSMIKTSDIPQSGSASGLAGTQAKIQMIQDPVFRDETAKVAVPLMPRWQAFKIAMGNKAAYDHYTSALYKSSREVTHIDPDLQVYKSFSPMAKITFQRQRNVERMIEGEFTDHSSNWPLWDIINKLMYGI